MSTLLTHFLFDVFTNIYLPLLFYFFVFDGTLTWGQRADGIIKNGMVGMESEVYSKLLFRIIKWTHLKLERWSAKKKKNEIKKPPRKRKKFLFPIFLDRCRFANYSNVREKQAKSIIERTKALRLQTEQDLKFHQQWQTNGLLQQTHNRKPTFQTSL